MDLEFTYKDDERLFSAFGRVPKIAIHLLKETVDDITDQIELEARERAPQGETGALKRHPVKRDEGFIGFESARTSTGEFAPTKGTLVIRESLTIPRQPKHAKWVHDGTGIYGPLHKLIKPRKQPYMIFEIDGQEFRRRFVRGQRPQPYLKEAFEFIDHTYTPVRLEILQAQINALI